ncbi:translocation and assembly module TamB [Gammaproteobacteria bacterium]
MSSLSLNPSSSALPPPLLSQSSFSPPLSPETDPSSPEVPAPKTRQTSDRWLWRIVRSWLTAGIALLIVGGILILLVLGTHTGLQLGVDTARRWLPGKLEAANIEGHLLGRLHLTGLYYENADLRLVIADLALDWQPATLLRGLVTIDRVVLKGFVFARKGAPSPPPPLPPLPVELHEARLEGLDFTPGPGQTPFHLDRAELVGRWAQGALTLDRLAVVVPNGEAMLTGQAVLQGPEERTVAGQLAWTVHLPDQPAITGSGAISGTLKNLTLEQTLDGKALAGRLLTRVMDLPEALRWQTQLNLTRFDSASYLTPSSPPPVGLLSGTITAHGTGQTGEVSADLRLAAPLATSLIWAGPWEAHLDLTGDLTKDRNHHQPRLTLHKLELHHPGNPLEVSLEGNLSLDEKDTPRTDVTMHWRTLTLPPTGPLQIESPLGEVSLVGTLTDYHYQMSATITGSGVPEARCQLAGHGNNRETQLEKFHWEILGGQLEGHGKANWHPVTPTTSKGEVPSNWAVSGALSLSGKDLDPGRQYPDWSGKMGFSLEGEGQIGGPTGPELSLHLIRLAGTLRGRPVEAAGQVSLGADGIRLREGVHLTSGAARLEANGRLGTTWDLDWQATVPDLADLWPKGTGRLTGHGHLKGPREKPRINLVLKGKDLAAAGQRLGVLDADLDVDLRGPFRAALTAQDLMLGTERLERLSITGKGSASQHRIDANISGPRGNFSLGLVGGLAENWLSDPEVWRGQVDRLNLTVPRFGQWSLSSPVSLVGGTRAITLGRLCLGDTSLATSSGKLCAEGRWQPDHANAMVRLSNLSLTRISGLEPKLSKLALQGELAGTLELTQDARRGISGQLSITSTPGNLVWRLDRAREVRLGWREAGVTLDLSGERVEGHANLTLNKGGELSASLALPRRPLERDPMQAPVTGEVRVSVTELGLISALVPEVVETSGQVRVQLTVGGTLAQPRVGGEATLEQGTIKVPKAGLHLKDLALTLRGHDDDRLEVEGRAHSGDSTLTVRGNVLPQPTAGFPTYLRIQGQDFRVIDLPEVRVAISPDLTVTTNRQQITINGKILVPSALIAPKTLLADTQGVSPDVVVAGREKEENRGEGPTISAQVTVELGKQIKLQAMGLTTQVEGQVTITGIPGQPPVASGELRTIGGVYKAHGQDLTLRHGRLFFTASPLDNPNLDVQAVRTLDEIVAGVNLRGSLQAPQLTLFSEPSVEQAQILAYLLTGHSMDGTSRPDANLLLQAAGSAGLGDGDVIEERIRTIFGLESVDIRQGNKNNQGSAFDPNNPNNPTNNLITQNNLPNTKNKERKDTSLVFGKYLSPNLYVSYGLGLFNRSSSLHLRYKLGKHWTLETESGTNADTGADLVYTIEVE